MGKQRPGSGKGKGGARVRASSAVADLPALQAHAGAGRINALFGYLLLAPALLPLVHIPGFLYPYHYPKALAFRSLGVVVLAALVYLVLSGRELYFDRLRQKITWIPAALLAVEYLTSLAGLGFHQGFWSSFERGDGLLTHTAAVLFFYAVLLHADAQFLRRLAVVSMWIASLVSLYAIVQWLQGGIRPGSTVGNPAFMACHLAMTFFLTLWVGRQGSSSWRLIVYGSAAVQLFAIVISGTRGTQLALLAAGIVVVVRIASQGAARGRTFARVSLAAVALVLTLFFIFRSQLALVPFVPLQRIAIMSPSGDSGATRIWLWEHIGRDALSRPLAGVGAEHLQDVFNTVYQPEAIDDLEWFDRSHNVFLDYFVQFGAPGLLLYAGLIAAALHASFSAPIGGAAAGRYLFPLFLAYAGQNFFVFDTAVTLWLFMAVLAGFIVLAGPGSSVSRLPVKRPWMGAAGALAILLLLIPVAVRPAQANMLLAQARSYGTGDFRQWTQALVRGFSLRTHANLEYGYFGYELYDNSPVPPAQEAAQLSAWQATLDMLTSNFRRYPQDVHTALCLAHLIELAPPGATKDPVLMNSALDRVMQLSPGRLLAWYVRANLEFARGDAAGSGVDRKAHFLKGIGILTQYADRYPSIAEPRYVIARIYNQIGDEASARRWADSADAVYRAYPGSAEQAIAYYASASQWARAVRFIEDLLNRAPGDLSLHRELVNARLLAGDKAGARAAADRMRAISAHALDDDPELRTRLELN